MSFDSSSTTRLLVAAAEVLRPGDTAPDTDSFTRAYRDWIRAHHSIPGSPDQRMEKVRMLMLAMLPARNLGEALDIMQRFGRLGLGKLAPEVAGCKGGTVTIRIGRPFRPGTAGLIGELWPLSLILSALEFLVGRQLAGAKGQVRHMPQLPVETVWLLFDRPLDYGKDELVLSFPVRHLALGLPATVEQVGRFQPRLLPRTFERADFDVELITLVEGLLRSDWLRGADVSVDASSIAGRLGCSVATLRRRLALEGSSFRRVRDNVMNELARHWLRERELTIGEIGERLGFRDGFSFSRSFTRMNGCSPAQWRRLSENVASG